jgi:PAS domain S-box-containing protein
MRAQSKIWISIAASLAVSAVIAYFAFSIVRGMSHDFARYQEYSAIINEAFALDSLIDEALMEESKARIKQQIGQVHGTLSKALESISSSDYREESLIRQIRRNNLELGPLIEQLFDQNEGASGAIDTERRDILGSQLRIKVRLITDDVNRLMEASGARILFAQAKTSLIVLILIGMAILSNAMIYFFSSRSMVRAQEELRKSREDLNRAQAVAHIGSWRMNVQKNELTWSDENHRIFGISPGKSMTYETFLGTVHPEDREYLNGEWMAALKGKPYDVEHRIVVAGAVKWVRERAELEFDSEGQLLGGFGTTQEITERKQAEEQIKRLASFPQMNPSPVLEIDFSGGINFYNQAALEAVAELGPEAGLGALIPQDLGEIIAAIRETQEKVFYREVRLKDKVFGQNVYFVESFQVLRLYSMDITKRQQAEEKLQRTLEDLERSNKELQEFAYIASHDLQEPLRKIANFSEMIVTQYQDRLDEQAERYFGYVIDGAKRMQALINDLLSYSRVGRAELTLVPASLEEILKGTLSNLQALIQESGAEISHDPLPACKVNPHQLGQLLQNLIINGIKFHGHRAPRIHLSARQEGQEWVIAVRDHGIGFDPQYVEGIFKVFKRLHSKEQYPGTGIGLAICKKIVERHGGRIWAESEPGRGATFYFTIPA